MRWRSLAWLLVSALCFCGAIYFWRLGDKWAAQQKAAHTSNVPAGGARRGSGPALLAETTGGTLNSGTATGVATNTLARATNRTALRLSNTSVPFEKLVSSPTAILLENALIDTAEKSPLDIPDDLKAKDDPGAYIVQSKKPVDKAFRSILDNAGATFVWYIPNNACLVEATSAAAGQLRGNPAVQAVEPYEPYYKLKGSMLRCAVGGVAVPTNAPVNVLTFASQTAATRKQLEAMGLRVYNGDNTPFGPVLTVLTPDGSNSGPATDVGTGNFLSAVAGLPGIQEMEWALRRTSANDLSRVSTGVTDDTLATTNYLGLTGTNVVVNVNDSGVDATQPDLAPRVTSPPGIFTNGLADPVGHGTHVAGIIASSGEHSTDPVNVGANASGSVSNASFRGMAPAAGIYSLPVDMFTGPFEQGVLFWPSDSELQQIPARTNVFISNNSWNYVGPDSETYDLHAASYDAAVRDALPFKTGSQPLLFVFSAGNSGGGNNNGQSGYADSIESPATAKNVITVGALEQLRNITNDVSKCTSDGTNAPTCTTNQPWLLMSDSSSQVASYSSRGNVGIGVEGKYGRFKPDLVAPGSFVVSTRSQQWDTNAYYNPTSHIFGLREYIVVPTNSLWRDSIFVPANTVQFNISVFPNTNSPVPFPDIPIYVRQSALPTNPPPLYDYVGTNSISLPPDYALNPVGVGWYYALGNNFTQSVSLDVLTDLVVTNEQGNYLEVLAGMNDALGPDYRYESGTSMAAASVSGNLALMQEFFQNLSVTNSPALMKALLINGARSAGPLYNINPRSSINFQGWGLINLPTAIPAALTNITASTNAIFVQDQSPGNALATGDSRTFKVTLTRAARNQPLRVTLVWTDPPGNPVASVKLVNDLDLVVTNLDNTNLVYIGNDIPAGHGDSNIPYNTNAPPNYDVVNNVENVFLAPEFGENSRLATNYSITVIGRRVNVNAVTAQTNNVVQDYALVISCGDGVLTNGLTLDGSAPIVSVTTPLVTVITNSFAGSTSNYTGGILLNQRAGANTPLLGTNQIPILNDANAVLTTGMTNQWHFYAITNENGFTNAAFGTFVPPTLSIPRMGVFSASDENSTRPEADIDMFVAPPTIANNYAITNLDPAVLSASVKALTRGGTETIVMSNAVAGVYYIGIKAEDQMAAEYGLFGVFSRFPFGSSDEDGNQSLIGFPAPAPIPDGSPQLPSSTYVIAIAAQPALVRRVVVTNTIQHELMSDLLGALSHDRQSVVLNNHTCVFNPVTFGCQTCTTFIYDDSDEMNVGPGITLCPAQVQHSDGPGSLTVFGGKEGTGQWMLTMIDNATNHVGTNVLLQIYLEKQPDLTVGNGVTFRLNPGACRTDYVQVPVNAISMSVTAAVVSATPPIDFTVTVCPPSGVDCKSTEVTNSIGGGVTTDLNDIPPLLPDKTYSVRTCNRGLTPITINLRAAFEFSESTQLPVLSTNTVGPVDILDDAVTDIYLTNNTHAIITSLDIGLLINSLRISDLAITLISPNGTRVLLFENRGGTSTNGLGTFNIITNFIAAPFYTNNFDFAAVGPYFPGAIFGGWNVLSNSVQVLDDYTCFCASNHILALMDGGISNMLPTTITMPPTNAMPYSLSFNVTHAPGLEGMVTWWPLDTNGVDLISGLNGLLFGDVTFSTGFSNSYNDEFAGPLNPQWVVPLPNTGGAFGPLPVLAYVGAPNYTFTTVGTNTVLRMTSTHAYNQRVGWTSTNVFKGQSFRYETRFNTLNNSPTTTPGFIEIWVLDVANSNRYDVISPVGGTLYMGSSVEGAYNSAPFNYASNTWYRLVIYAEPGKSVRMALLDDNGVELAGTTFLHGMAAFPAGVKIGLSQFTASTGSQTLDVAVDWVKMRAGLVGEVNQAFYGDGTATRMIVARCPELNLGRGRGLSIEGWINPYNVTNFGPLVEWNDPTNPAPLGVRFSTGLLNGPGSLGATIWDTNLIAHSLSTPPGVLTNLGWQHVALTYDTNSGIAALYVNGLTNTQPLVTTNLGQFVPRTSGDVYVGYDPTMAPVPINFPDFSSVANLNLAGVAARNGNLLALTSASPNNQGSAWYSQKQYCAGGFTTSFSFRISNVGGAGGGDGLSFAIQNAGPFDLGHEYGANTNDLGISFNTYQNPGEVSGNFIAICTNSAHYIFQRNLNGIINLKDGNAHSVNIQCYGQRLTVTIDNITVITNFPVPLSVALDTNGYSWVGFSGRCGAAAWERHDILNWSFGLASPGTSFAGGLDEFSLYNRALSPCEVGAIYGAGTRGKYGTNVLVCPVQTEVTLLTGSGPQTYRFTNGVSWTNNGPFWETNVIDFSTSSTNPTPIIVRGLDPYGSATNANAGNNLNVALDNFVLTGLSPQYFNGMLHFTEDTNLATIPIKFAPEPYNATNTPDILVFSNSFVLGVPGLYQPGTTIAGSTNDPAIGNRAWTVTNGAVTVLSNAFLDAAFTNSLAMATGTVQCLLPTIPGHRYQLNYTLRGPCAVGWWNGTVDPLSERALDLISGNNGAFLYGATNTVALYQGDTSQAFVGLGGFFFSGQTEPSPDQDPDLWPEDIDDPGSKIELGDPPQLQLTNGFTIETWVKPMVPTNDEAVCGTEMLFFRGYPEPFDCSGSGDPYWLALQPALDGSIVHREIQFHIAAAHSGTNYADVFTTNSPVIIDGGTNDGWWHIAAVFDKPFTNIVVTNGTNIVVLSTNAMRLYLNGVCVATNQTTHSPYQLLDPALSPGVTIGNRSRYDWTQPFSGWMDEITVYARALTDPEIAAIAAGGMNGKAATGVPTSQSLAQLNVSIDGVKMATSYGENSRWTTRSVDFTALRTNSLLSLQSLEPGTLLEGVTLVEQPSELYYLPEVSLSDLFGEDAYGVWTLEIWDNRVGSGITNLAQLIEWQLNFGLGPSNPPPVIALSHGIPYTNTIPAHGMQYFIVPSPQWATNATNTLLFANRRQTPIPLPVSVLYNPTNFPTIADFALIGPGASSGTVTLSTNGSPSFVPGQAYFLAVTNPNPVGATFALEVSYDIVTLTNCTLSTSNIVGPGGIPRYFQFDVPTNTLPPGVVPEAVSFWLSSATCGVAVVMSQHLPLPDLNHFDYISDVSCTNDQVIMLVTNTTPFPIQTNRWYIGVFNSTASNVMFSAQACYQTNYPRVIQLTNAIPFVVPTTASVFAAPPGPPQWLFYEFIVTNKTAGVLFELYNLSGDADLVLQRAVPPTMAPYYDGSFATGTSPEQIVLRPNAEVPDLRGVWYLGVYNNESRNVSYSIRATLPNGNGLLTSAVPLRIGLTTLPPPHGLLLSWNSIIGERYIVQYTPSLGSSATWSNLGSVLATTPLTTFEVIPPPLNGGFFRVIQTLSYVPTLRIESSGSLIKLSWSVAFPGYRLQSKPLLGTPGGWTDVPGALTIANGEYYIVIDTTGTPSMYYRLIK